MKQELLNKFSVGYNRTGQDFFDLLNLYRPYIHSYYFSPTWVLGERLTWEKELETMAKLNTYGIQGNILFNHTLIDTLVESEEILSEFLLLDHLNLKAITVLNHYQVELFRDLGLEFHLSTAADPAIDSIGDLTREFRMGDLQCVNLSSQRMFDHEFMHAVKWWRIQVKLIANENCLFMKNGFSNYLFGEDICGRKNEAHVGDFCGLACYKKLVGDLRWLNLTRMGFTKEFLEYLTEVDIVKFATRSMDNDSISELLKSWVSPSRTKSFCGIQFENGIPEEFVRERLDHTCDHHCLECEYCKELYEKECLKEDNWEACRC